MLHGSICNAQYSLNDSLRKVLLTAKEDTGKVNTLLALSKNYFNTSPEDAITYANEAKNLAEHLNFKKGIAYALKNMGIANYMQGKYLESLENYEQSLAIFSAIGDKAGVANILSNQGAVYFNRSEDVKALELYLKSLTVAEQIGDTLRILTALQNIGAVYSHKPAMHDKALQYYLKALPLSELVKDENAIGTITVNLGEIYLSRGDDSSALFYFKKSLKAFENSENIPYTLNDIGKVYAMRGNYASAVNYHKQAYQLSKKLDAKVDMAQSLLGIADVYMKQGDEGKAITFYKQAEAIARKISNTNYELKNAYRGLAISYAKRSDYKNAYKYETMYSSIKDSLYNIDTDKKLSGLQFNFDIQKKQVQIDLLTKDKALQELDLKRQKQAKNAFVIGFILVFIIAFISYSNYRIKVKTNKILDSQKAEIEHLLLNILPAEVAQELQQNGHAAPRYYKSVSVLFTDFKGFTKLADALSPQEVVSELDACFIAFDDIIEKYGLEKIKTIGDSYMCAGGIPSTNDAHPIDIIKASLDIRDYMNTWNEKRTTLGLPLWELRIGINTGPVVAGVVGRKKYAYDIWGKTVNIASRMESNGEPGQVNISATTFNLVKDTFRCTYRGKISAKNVGEIDMYFVDRI